MTTAPVVDIQEVGLFVEDFSKENDKALKSVGDAVIKAFKTFGFCYIKNHGVDWTLVRDYLQASRDFFKLLTDEKAKYKINSKLNFGWLKLEGKKLETDIGDLHEVFKYTPLNDYAWPPVDEFETHTKELYDSCIELSRRFLTMLAIGLDLPTDFFANAHKLLGQDGNSTATRTLYYPAITKKVKPGQTRLGEHFDYGTIAFTFQDNTGGLEMKTPTGKYIPVTPIDGLISIHPGMMLQRWTADGIQGTLHRVLLPEDEERMKLERLSVTFFLMPDDNFPIKCIDRSDKYETITANDFFTVMYSKTFNA